MKEDSRARTSCFPMSLKSKKKKAMCADSDPASQIVLISWMIAELREHELSRPQITELVITYVRTLLPAPAMGTDMYERGQG
jgi:hypothetical protein